MNASHCGNTLGSKQRIQLFETKTCSYLNHSEHLHGFASSNNQVTYLKKNKNNNNKKLAGTRNILWLKHKEVGYFCFRSTVRAVSGLCIQSGHTLMMWGEMFSSNDEAAD